MVTQVQKIHIRDDSKLERLLRKPAFWIIFVLIVFSYPLVRSVYRQLPPPLPVYSEVPQFQLTTEFGQPFGSKELKNRVYVASFFHIDCPTNCASHMAKLKKIQKRLRGLGQNVAILSITVDPELDNQKRLYRYSRDLKSNPHVWKFLTGAKEDIRTLLIGGFKVPMGERTPLTGVEVEGFLPDEMYTIPHSEQLVLVDADGKIRGYYNTTDNEINKMMIDIGLLVNREYQQYEI